MQVGIRTLNSIGIFQKGGDEYETVHDTKSRTLFRGLLSLVLGTTLNCLVLGTTENCPSTF